MKTWYTIRARGTGAEVLIYDEIGAYGVSAKGFLAELGALPDGMPLDLRLNSPGGSVFDAVAIFNALTRHAGPITVWIDGIAASAASYVAMAGDEIIMPENAFLMIHDPSGIVMGTAADMREMAATMDKIAGSMIRGYAGRSGRSEEEIAALMAAETWFDAKDALHLGLVDRIDAPVKLAACFDVARFRNAPPELVEAITETVGASNGSDRDSASEADAAGAEGPEGDGGHHNIPQDEFPPPKGQDADVPGGNTNQIPTGSDGTVAGAKTAPEASTIRAEAIAHAFAVIDLCRLAGQPQMAGRFLEEDASLDDVRTRILAAKAEATAHITAAHAQPGRAATTQSWGEVIARTFKTKG
jgi:ATP-dependent Clp protease protease subunit